jgi:hypothetical protein
MATRIRRKPTLTFEQPEARVVALYAPGTGEILHAVTIAVDEGSEAPSPAEAERIARECAEIDERIQTAVLALHVASRDFDRNAALKVDPKTRKLIRAAAARPPAAPAARKKAVKKAKRG